MKEKKNIVESILSSLNCSRYEDVYKFDRSSTINRTSNKRFLNPHKTMGILFRLVGDKSGWKKCD